MSCHLRGMRKYSMESTIPKNEILSYRIVSFYYNEHQRISVPQIASYIPIKNQEHGQDQLKRH